MRYERTSGAIMKISRRRPWLAGVIAAAVTVPVALAGALTATVAQAATGCRVQYKITSSWPGGFGAEVAVDNLGGPVSSWQLTWSFTAGQAITQLWNGSYTQTGAAVTVRNATWNGSLATGAQVTVGFNA